MHTYMCVCVCVCENPNCSLHFVPHISYCVNKETQTKKYISQDLVKYSRVTPMAMKFAA